MDEVAEANADARAGMPRPDEAADAAELVAAMRRLKNWSGHSYRELERRAAAAGDALPRSTVTLALTRDTLPREDMLAAFVRACGGDDDQVRCWITARRRIAGAGRTGPDPAVRVEELPRRPDTAYRGVRRLVAALTVVVAVVGAVAVFALVENEANRTAPAGSDPAPGPPVMDLPPPDERLLRTPPPAPAGAPTVLYVGETIARQTRNALAYFVHRTGRGAVVATEQPGSAICDHLGGTPNSSVPATRRLPAMIRSVRPRVVVMQFWGHSSEYTPCTGGARPDRDDYYHRYWNDAHQAVRQITEAARQAGIPRPRVVWVLQPPDAGDPDRVRRLNQDVYTTVAHAHQDLTSDAGWQLSTAAHGGPPIPDGRHRSPQFSPCTPDERRHGYCTHPRMDGGMAQLYRKTDDRKLHLCLTSAILDPQPCDSRSPGVIRYARTIAATATAALE
ncbi:hypothetical protein [Actinomadura craniellae]|uniref:hypothetical protein n=1 Tax=Actinomadura craniellae TaxID=2231787 RepID=UPI0018F11CC4|nr:hypothetical protein [Actinomadura craniellae]